MSNGNNNKDNAKKKSFMEKWNDLTTVTKSIYAAVIAIPALIGAFITIWGMITPKELPIELKDRINNIEFLDKITVSHVLDSCAMYKKKGFTEFLYKYEKLECRGDAKDYIMSWFKKPSNKFNKRKYVQVLFDRSEIFFNEYIDDIIKNDVKLDGVYNYIDLYAYMGKEKNKKAIKALNDWKRKYEIEAKKDDSGDYNNIEIFSDNVNNSIDKLSSN